MAMRWPKLAGRRGVDVQLLDSWMPTVGMMEHGRRIALSIVPASPRIGDE